MCVHASARRGGTSEACVRGTNKPHNEQRALNVWPAPAACSDEDLTSSAMVAPFMVLS